MIVAPSLLSFDYTNLSREVNVFNELVEWYHFDVMDGNFVPNLSFGPKILSDLKKITNLFLDVHLMVNDPTYYSDVFRKAGADLITFHYEAMESPVACHELIKHIHDLGAKCGISVKPGTDVHVLNEFLDEVDLVLVMSVEPGFGGQKFMPIAYEKIAYLADLRKVNNYHFLIEVDGGVCDANGHQLVETGADVLVSGSYLTKGDPKENLQKLIG